MMITRRLLAAGACALPLAAPRAQEAFPTRPIQVVMPYAPGNATDVLLRALTPSMASTLGQPLVVINREGAAGAVGSASVARAAPDGYTLLFVPALVASVLPVTQAGSGLRAESFAPICQTFSNTMALVVRPDSPITDLRALQAAARARPGRVTYGTLGITSIPHLAMEQWAAAAGVQVEHVPYRSSGMVITELLAGRIDIGAIVLGTVPGLREMRMLTVFDARRHPDFPDAPTALEQGFDVQPASFGGLFAPAGTPEAVLARLEAACAAAAASETYRNTARSGFQPADFYRSRADFTRRLRQDIDDKAAVLRTIRLN